MTNEDAPRASCVVGVGACQDTDAREISQLIQRTLRSAGLQASAVRALATVDVREREPGIVAAASELGVPLCAYPASALAAVTVPHPSGVAQAALGTPSVAEAAALLCAGEPHAELLVPKRRSAPEGRPSMATCALARPAPVPDLRHHGDAEVRDAGPDLTDLAVNVRTGTPPRWLRERLANSLSGLASYPDGRAARGAVARRHGLAEEQVLLTAGAAEAFVLVARTVSARHASVVHPQFTEPEAALRDAGLPVSRVLLSERDGFRLAPDAVAQDRDLVLVGNPTNPTSVLHPAGVLAELAVPGRTLVVDEAFIDAVPGEAESLVPWIGRLPGRVVVLRSLTKTWGLAGLRIGYVLSDAATIAELAARQPLWPVSTPALVAAEACSTPAALAEAAGAAEELATWREYLIRRLGEFEALRPARVAARAPFVLIHHPRAPWLRERLRELGFALRRGDTFPGLGPAWLRLAVRDPATTDRLVHALRRAGVDEPAPHPSGPPPPGEEQGASDGEQPKPRTDQVWGA